MWMIDAFVFRREKIRLQKFKWQNIVHLTIIFLVLSFFLAYDRSYLDSALVILDQQVKPVISNSQELTYSSVESVPLIPPKSSPPLLTVIPKVLSLATLIPPQSSPLLTTIPEVLSLATETPPIPSLSPAPSLLPLSSIILPLSQPLQVSPSQPLQVSDLQSHLPELPSPSPVASLPPVQSLPPIAIPKPGTALKHSRSHESRQSSSGKCDIFDGTWVHDDTYPLYDTCPFAERDFQCHLNGRPDRAYQNWRWQPTHCDIPRFDPVDMLKRLKGKRVVFVGDSMSRTQWESLNCLLLQGVPNKSSVVMTDAPIGRRKLHIGARFLDHDITIDYYRSPWIVHSDPLVPKGTPKSMKSTIKLKEVDLGVAMKFIDSDVLLINSGHWWTRRKTYDSGVFFQVGDKVFRDMEVIDAYRIAMTSATSWVNENVNFSRTEVFFRSFETPHWENPMATTPYNAAGFKLGDPRPPILRDVVGKMDPPATVLDITSMTAYRPDGHVFNWTAGHGRRVVDCAHWCVPGVPDTWNELLFGSMLQRGRGVWSTADQ